MTSPTMRIANQDHPRLKELTTVSDGTLLAEMQSIPAFKQYARKAQSHSDLMRQMELVWKDFVVNSANFEAYSSWQDAWKDFCIWACNEAVECLIEYLPNCAEPVEFKDDPEPYVLYMCDYGALRIYENGCVTEKMKKLGPACVVLWAVANDQPLQYTYLDEVRVQEYMTHSKLGFN
ncbi:hypothetical protein [Neptuniibacter sp. QD37_11]|uniref:hypothetical protein n=1 Tax=Neptuniibacter sp. QD37_11 TaxID=3398209 RepID=UPI0039F5707F